MAIDHGVSIVCESALDERPISLDVADQEIGDVMSAIARRLGVETNRTGQLFFIGSLRPEDKGVLVTRVGQLSSDEVQQAVNLLLSTQGRAVVVQNGVAVVGDKVAVLALVDEALTKLRDVQRVTWLVQLHVLQVSADDALSLGVNSEVGVRATLDVPGRASGSVHVDSVLAGLRESGDTDVIAEPLCVVNDGQKFRFRAGETFSVSESTLVAGGGQATTQRMQDAGFLVELQMRSRGADDGTLVLSVSDQAVVGTPDRPSLSGYELASELDVISGGTYLVGSTKVTKSSRLQRLGLSLFGQRSETSRVIQLWARVYRVGAVRSQEFDAMRDAAK